MSLAIKQQTTKPAPTAWDKERRKRNKLTAADWAQALSGAGDYSAYEFSLGSNPAVAFIDHLTHTGDYAGKPFELELWQEAMLRLIFDPEGIPRYRYVLIGLPRKNGKTELIAAVVCYLIFGTGIRAQNIYSGSGDAEQAGLIHKAAAAMIQQNEELSGVAHVYKGNVKRILFEPMGTEYKALSSEAYSKFGLRPSVNLYDEVHVFPNRELHSALETAFGATKRPFTIYITTAGWDRTSLCWELWQRAREAMRDPASDPKFLGILYEFKEDDDWTDEATWHQINPGLGKFRSLENLREDFQKAVRFPAYENEFRQFYLNQWTEQAQRWISVDSWNACADCLGDLDIPFGTPCYAGFDHGVTGDMSAFWLAWPINGGVKVAGRCWVPKDGKWRDELRNKDRYELWHKTGKLRFTPGNAMDEEQIRKEIAEFNEHTPIISLFADRAYCTGMLNWLFNECMIPVKGIPQGSVTLNEACVALEEMVLAREIEHGGNPILDWAMANASVKRNSTGLIHPDKSSATERIDALSALINALAAMKADPENRSTLVYEQAGQLAL
jgi:phage terminase large subunit-like protein